ncbi:MAG TPA: tetratricopeptide repeat protein [Gemmatimonadales bacterium]|nr:tetratricopeptide repeat protein [Gemmatimonadales bacterium]
MNLEKLKDSARKFEQKEDWRKAIEVYLRAIQQIESGVETSPDLSLYNRVGDLHLKTNDTASAVHSYERAVDLYADQGFFNNAIALCGKILRVNPGRTQTYLKLAQLHARKNVVIEAKRNLIEFLERMNALGQLDQAFQSVKEFADQFSGSQEIRMMLVELLRAASREDEAREQLEKLAGQLETRGGRRSLDRHSAVEAEESTPAASRPMMRGAGGLVFLDTSMEVPASAPPRGEASPAAAEPPDGLMLIEPVAADGEEPEPAESLVEEPIVAADDLAPLTGLERTEEIELEPAEVESEEIGLERVEVEAIDFEGVPLEGMDETILDTGSEPVLDEVVIDREDELLVSVDDSAPLTDSGEDVELDLVDAVTTDDLPMIETAVSGATVTELEGRILDDPDNAALHRELGEALLATTDVARGLEELELALEGYEQVEEYAEAARIADRLTGVAPDNIRYHQKRVELAYRAGDRTPLLRAYLALGDALARAGATDKAIAVFNRVREHDPGNSHALAALAGLAEPVEEAAPEAPQETVPDEEPAEETPAPVAAAAPAPPPAPPAPPPEPTPRPRDPGGGDGAFVDLGSMILDSDSPRDTRMRIDRREPHDEDEQREFHEILEQFKRGIEQNLEVDDYEAHYDLGVAFKEMGLLDEAIAEFQKALRAPEGRLRTSEALGVCFYDKGQFAVSETVLRRAVDTLEGGDEAKIGLLYWLGRAAEAQGKAPDAIGSYERALAVDIRFMDLSDRIHRLTAGRRE